MRAFRFGAALLAAMLGLLGLSGAVEAQKAGGTLRVLLGDTPPQMRRHPIATGPFRFVELKPNERVRVEKTRDYWKPGRPYLDAIEYTIIANRAPRMLAFTAGRVDMTFPTEVTVPLLKDVRQ